MIPLVLLVLAAHGHHRGHKSELTRALEALDRSVQTCLPDGAPGGRLKLRWQITSTGEATALFTDRDGSTVEDDAVIDCAVEKVQDFSFPNQDHDRTVRRTFHLGHAKTKHHRKRRSR